MVNFKKFFGFNLNLVFVESLPDTKNRHKFTPREGGVKMKYIPNGLKHPQGVMMTHRKYNAWLPVFGRRKFLAQ